VEHQAADPLAHLSMKSLQIRNDDNSAELAKLPDVWWFHELRSAGLISQAMFEAIPDLIRLSQLFGQARARTLTKDDAKELLRLKWGCSSALHQLTPTKASDRTALERILVPVLQLVLTLCMNSSMTAVAEYYCPAIIQQLANVDLAPIVQTSPEALLWILLVLGTCSVSPGVLQDQEFVDTSTALVAGQLRIMDAEEALALATQFIWAPHLDTAAVKFWSRAVGTSSAETLMARQI
jgi:hypothetical protein